MTLYERFQDEIFEMLKNSRAHADRVVNSENVYQEKNSINRPIFSRIVEALLKKNSRLEGCDNLQELSSLAANGHSCLMLPAHLSNFDVPVLWMLMHWAGEEFAKIFEKIIFVAGRKLNEENEIVKMLTEMFTRVVISPKSSYGNLPEGEQKQKMLQEAKAINIAAHRKIRELKTQDRIFLVYPAGTRFRPWDAESGQGLREVEAYVRSFEYFVVGGTKGNLMPPQKGEMKDEIPVEDTVVMKFGKVYKSSEFRQGCLKELEAEGTSETVDSKQYIIDRIMDEIADLSASIRI